jgi:hypothetical protein
LSPLIAITDPPEARVPPVLDAVLDMLTTITDPDPLEYKEILKKGLALLAKGGPQEVPSQAPKPIEKLHKKALQIGGALQSGRESLLGAHGKLHALQYLKQLKRMKKDVRKKEKILRDFARLKKNGFDPNVIGMIESSIETVMKMPINIEQIKNILYDDTSEMASSDIASSDTSSPDEFLDKLKKRKDGLQKEIKEEIQKEGSFELARLTNHLIDVFDLERMVTRTKEIYDAHAEIPKAIEGKQSLLFENVDRELYYPGRIHFWEASAWLNTAVEWVDALPLVRGNDIDKVIMKIKDALETSSKNIEITKKAIAAAYDPKITYDDIGTIEKQLEQAAKKATANSTAE